MAHNYPRVVAYISFGVIVAIVLAFVVSFVPMVSVNLNNDQRMYHDISATPYRKVGLLLGTSKYTRDGAVNHYYYSRLYAAAGLYVNGRIEKILASGDNRSPNYNEPQQMLDTLLKLGVKREDIILDSAGLRTFDSIVRAATIFDISEYTIITQYPHNVRALYIADHFGHRAIAYSTHISPEHSRVYFHAREILARIKAVLDIHILGTTPRYPGS